MFSAQQFVVGWIEYAAIVAICLQSPSLLSIACVNRPIA